MMWRYHTLPVKTIFQSASRRGGKRSLQNLGKLGYGSIGEGSRDRSQYLGGTPTRAEREEGPAGSSQEIRREWKLRAGAASRCAEGCRRGKLRPRRPVGDSRG